MARRAARRRTVSKSNGTKAHRKPRRVKTLIKYLKAYGRGSNAIVLRKQFAKRVGTSLSYLVHISYGYRVASPSMSAMIEKQTHGLVTCEELRPDIDWVFLSQRRAPAQQQPGA